MASSSRDVPTRSTSRNPNDPDIEEMRRQDILLPVSARIEKLQSGIKRDLLFGPKRESRVIEPLPAGIMRVPLSSDGTVPSPRKGSHECPGKISSVYSRAMQSEEFGMFEVAVPERRWHEAEEASFPPESWPVPSKETFRTLHTINCNPAFRAITRQHAGMLYNFKPGDKYILKKISADKTESVILHNNRITGDDAIVHRRRNHRDPIFCGRPWLEQDALDPSRKARPE